MRWFSCNIAELAVAIATTIDDHDGLHRCQSRRFESLEYAKYMRACLPVGTRLVGVTHETLRPRLAYASRFSAEWRVFEGGRIQGYVRQQWSGSLCGTRP